MNTTSKLPPITKIFRSIKNNEIFSIYDKKYLVSDKGVSLKLLILLVGISLIIIAAYIWVLKSGFIIALQDINNTFSFIKFFITSIVNIIIIYHAIRVFFYSIASKILTKYIVKD